MNCMKKDLLYADHVISYWMRLVKHVAAMWNTGQLLNMESVRIRSGNNGGLIRGNMICNHVPLISFKIYVENILDKLKFIFISVWNSIPFWLVIFCFHNKIGIHAYKLVGNFFVLHWYVINLNFNVLGIVAERFAEYC